MMIMSDLAMYPMKEVGSDFYFIRESCPCRLGQELARFGKYIIHYVDDCTGGPELFDYDKVDTVVKRIVENVNPRMIVVFGSVARREARDDSDLDILVVFDGDIDEKEMYRRVSGLFIGLKLDFDLIVMGSNDFERYKDNEYSFTHEIMSTGEVVYVQ